jgi:ferrochelatase
MSGHTNPASGTGILLVNLGSPDSPSIADVRRYLGQFLMDKHVIDAPYPIRKMIVSGFILPFRPKRSAHAYQSIWWDEGSPLIAISRRVQKLLAERGDFAVELAMRYGNPSIEAGLRALAERHSEIDKVRVIPLYPHYAMSTVQSTLVEVEKVAGRTKLSVDLEYVRPFYNEPHYIRALAESARGYLERGYDHLLVSYHGLPERHLRKTDPTGSHCLSSSECCELPSEAHERCYRHQVLKTTELLVETLEIPRDRYTVSFQSRLGKDAWMQPFTVDEAVRLAGAGAKKLLVICPAFVSDCLETLEEIGIGVKERFLKAGGEAFEVIPCLNDHPMWIDALQRYATGDSYAAPLGGNGARRQVG